MFDPACLADRPYSLWRYWEALGIQPDGFRLAMGEVCTPLVPILVENHPVLLKLDHLFPTGSFKDRGSAVMFSKLRQWGIREVVEDSSGNAGASIAAYAAAAGIRARIFIPAAASAAKTMQVKVYGADLSTIEGSREDAMRAALSAAANSFYASHNWNPHFCAGMKSTAYEIAEQLGWHAPDWVIAPVGGGSLVVGLWRGFQDLHRAAIIASAPRLAGVQAKSCPPVYEAWQADGPPLARSQNDPASPKASRSQTRFAPGGPTSASRVQRRGGGGVRTRHLGCRADPGKSRSLCRADRRRRIRWFQSPPRARRHPQ